MSGLAVLFASSVLATALNPAPATAPYGPQSQASAPVTSHSDSGSVPATLAPGLVRPASYVIPRQKAWPEGRDFMCADDKCKKVYPVHNTGTPIERERGRLARD